MNAKELADELEIAQGNNNADELIPKAIAMLRILDGQLAFRIDAVTKYQAWIKELEISKQSWEIIAKGYGKTIDEQQAEIEVLKKQCALLQEGYNAQAILLGVETGLTPDFFFMENDLMGKR